MQYLKGIIEGCNFTLYPTQCCAMMQITCTNELIVEKLQSVIKATEERYQAEKEYQKNDKGYIAEAPRCFYIMCRENEDTLKQKIKSIGFTAVHILGRKACYPEGTNEMYVYNIN